ncbi:hypothetical protein EDD17DRAFT_349968 [Pisolithus thermaeus]|nr:hypothetical protein EV401DRAFT_1412794 [Pisolithus croceorrhizus]KAI6164466.1 hypothetical protein EDD17DRAFT_349968 [Pisolithus thermaeus]
MSSTPSDTSRLPSYKHSYMLRFHPYPRTGPVRQEPLEALDESDVELEDANENPRPGKGDPGQPADEVETLIQAIHPRDKEPSEGKVTRSRRNSLTSQVIDLALLVTRKST